MGAENSILDDVSLEDPLPNAHPMWTFRHGVLEDDTVVTVLSDESGDKQKRVLFHRCMKFLKSVRHPQILRYLSSHETSAGSHMVTERVTPLSPVLDDLDSTEICAGLYGVIEGLSFLHDKIGVSHNNICTDAVYVSPLGAWKIGGLDHVCKYLDVTPSYLESSRKFRNEKSISPEEKEGKLIVTAELGHTRDVYSFGVWAESLLEHMGDLGDMTKTFELRIQDECLSPNPKQRPKLNTLLDDRLFRCDLLSITKFLSNITLKSEQEKKEFFSDLVPKLLALPEDVIGKCLTQLLLCRFVLLDKSAASCLVPHILTPNRDSEATKDTTQGSTSPLFSVPKFQQYVIPELYKVFHCHDYHIRMLLLTHFAKYVDLFDKKDLEEVIFPQILIGIRDSNEDLAALSLHCLADMVTVLGRATVIGGKSKVYFTKGTPKHNTFTNRNEKTNMNGVVEKRLLKDLVNTSRTGEKISRIRHEEGMEQKRKERQEKLKEARLKREQRRLEKLSQQKSIDNRIKSEDKDVPLITVELPQTLTEKGALSTKSITATTESKLIIESVSSQPISPAKSPDTKNREKEKKKFVEEIKIEPDIYVNEEEETSEEDWSDWDNAVEGDQSPSRNSVDTNDYVSTISKLSPKSSEVLDSSNKVKDTWDSHWSHKSSSHQSHAKQNVPKVMSSTKAPMKLQSNQKKKQKKNTDPLGSEFDIKSVEIKLKEESARELDFFADMTPNIKPSAIKFGDDITEPKNKGGFSGAHSDSKGTDSKSTTVSQNLMFASADTAETDAVGWGDDINWDDEGF